MATNCGGYVFGRRLRVTKLDNCGRPVPGAKSTVITNGFISVKLSPQVVEGDDITVKNAGGELCLAAKACDTIKWANIEASFCTVDPDLVALMNPTWEPEVDQQGNTGGFRMVTSLNCNTGYALELWTDIAGVDLCAMGSNAQGGWGYVLIPYVIGMAVGDLEYTNKEVSFTFKGRTKPFAKWGVGPYNVYQDATGAPKPLAAAIDGQTWAMMTMTTLAPPPAACGAIPLPSVPQALPAPTGLAVASSPAPTPVAFQVNWTAVPNATSYSATAVKQGTTTPVLTGTVVGTQANFSGLTNSSTYVVSVVAVGDGVYYSNSTAATVNATTAAPQQLPTPQNVTAQGTPGTTSFTAQWSAVTPTPPGSPQYTATAVKQGTTTPVLTGTVTGTTANFTGLTTATTYVVSVIAKGDGTNYLDSNAGTGNITTT